MQNNGQKNGHLREAKKILTLAKKEYARAKKSKNEMKTRQAAEKGYLCLVRAVNALFVREGVSTEKLPKGERGRRHFLGRYADKETRGKYAQIRHDLHIDAFHEGIIVYKDLDERFSDLAKLVKRVENG